MQQLFNRKEKILRWIQPHMEERFYDSCQIIQKEVENHGNKIWRELEEIICDMMLCVDNLQKQDKKGSIKYLVFSFLNNSIYLNRLEYRIDVFDDEFYMDEQEVGRYYCPCFIQKRYQCDREFFHQKVITEFKRVQNYEMIDVDIEYAKFFNSVVYMLIQSLYQLIIDVIRESGVHMAKNFKIIYGEYMDRSVVINQEEA